MKIARGKKIITLNEIFWKKLRSTSSNFEFGHLWICPEGSVQNKKFVVSDDRQTTMNVFDVKDRVSFVFHKNSYSMIQRKNV